MSVTRFHFVSRPEQGVGLEKKQVRAKTQATVRSEAVVLSWPLDLETGRAMVQDAAGLLRRWNFQVHSSSFSTCESSFSQTIRLSLSLCFNPCSFFQVFKVEKNSRLQYLLTSLTLHRVNSPLEFALVIIRSLRFRYKPGSKSRQTRL
jgi:hypothetical protein